MRFVMIRFPQVLLSDIMKYFSLFLLKDILVQSERANGPEVLQLSAAASSTGWYRRIQATELSPLQRPEEGPVQTGSMV